MARLLAEYPLTGPTIGVHEMGEIEETVPIAAWPLRGGKDSERETGSSRGHGKEK